MSELQTLPHSKLLVLQSELESLIQIYSKTLVQELALRDELEFEKELKNTFISLILNIQNKRRQFHLDKKLKGASRAVSAAANGQLPQHLTAVVPFNEERPLDCTTLQILVKILRAVNDDSPNVPSLLTDYILNVLCPSNSTSLVVC